METATVLLRRLRLASAVYLSGLFAPTPGSRTTGGRHLLLLLLLTSTSCKNFNMYTVEDDILLGTQAFEEVTKDERILTSGPAFEQVQRVTERLVASVMEYRPEIAPRFEWEVVVIDDPGTINAFCLPGGKMAVYTGILEVAGGDAGLAVVMGHEIAHATEQHGTERLTRQGLTGTAIQILLEDENQQEVASVLANLGLGLPWGREDELEADMVGLMILANAGYDPREAPEFWTRMSQMAGGGDDSPLSEFLSTHPSNAKRISRLKAAIPAALPLYETWKAGNP